MKAIDSLVKGVSKVLDKTQSRLSNFGVGKYLYKNLAISLTVLGIPLYAGASGSQKALEKIKTENYIEAPALTYDATKEENSKTINYQDAVKQSNYFSDSDENFNYSCVPETGNIKDISKEKNKIKPKKEINYNYASVNDSIKNIKVLYNNINNPQDSVPVQNINKEIMGYASKDNALKEKLFHSPKDKAFYSKEVSRQIKEDIKKGNKNITDFYGDQVLNSFIQPNYLYTDYSIPGEFNLHYYGSGDANDDGALNFDDYDAIVAGTSNDRTDIDGDGTPSTTADQQILYNYLTDQIPYLPGHWELLQTTAEKINWLEKVLAIDTTNLIPFGDCDKWSMQTLINLVGIENIANSGINFNTYDTTMNARFNISGYGVSTRATNGEAHAINAVLVGENPTNFDDWYFFEPQTDARVFPGDFSMDANEFANIDRYCYFFNELFQQYMYGPFPVIDFNLTNGNASVSWQHPDLVVNKPIELTYINIGGQGPNDTTLLYQVAFENSNPDPSVSGDVTGNAAWSSRFYSDSTSYRGTPADSIFFNFDAHRDFSAISDSSALIDTMYMTNDNRYTCDSAQLIEVRDWENPGITRNQTTYSMLYTEWLSNGIALSTITDNCGPYWDSTHTQTNTQGPPNTCGFYNFVVTDSTSACDPSNNDTSDVFQVTVNLDPNQWTYFPENDSIFYWIPTTPANTNGPAQASNPAGTPVNVTWDTISYKDPDTNNCACYNFPVDMIYTKTDSICGTSSDSTQYITKYKPNSLINIYFPDSITISRDDPIEPWFTGEPLYSDTLEPWFPTSYGYWDEVVSATPTDTIYHRHFSGMENICFTTTPDSIHVITRDLLIGIDGGLEKELKKDYIKIFPNPTSNNVSVKVDYMFSGIKNLHIEIYDIRGRLVDHFTEKISQGQNPFKLDLSDKANGMYFIEFSSDGKKLLEVEKVVVQK